MPIIDDVFLSTLVREPLAPAVPEEEEKAFSRISRLVASRERCACELEKRLVQDGFSERDAQSAIARAVSCGMVDDLRYADIRSFEGVPGQRPRGHRGGAESLRHRPSPACRLARRILRHRRCFRGRPCFRLSLPQTPSFEKRLCRRMSEACRSRLFAGCGLRCSAALCET